jgi:hypothetical protein
LEIRVGVEGCKGCKVGREFAAFDPKGTTVSTTNVQTVDIPIILPPAWLELWRERAGLMQDGGLAPEEAAREALLDVLRRIETRERLSAPCRCAACIKRKGGGE